VGSGLRREFLAANLLAWEWQSLAFCGEHSPIRIGADQHETGVAAKREAEEPDTLGIDPGCCRRDVEHGIDQALAVGRPLDGFHQTDGAGPVARVRDGGDDKAGVGERLGQIVMGEEVYRCSASTSIPLANS
jgi:hypothetical protein